MIKRHAKVLAILFCLSYLQAHIAHGDEAPAPNIIAGQKLATQLCARCHAITKNGQSPFKPAPPFRSFASKWPLESLEEALGEGIVVGHPAMPEFKLKTGQISNLLGYIATLSPR